MEDYCSEEMSSFCSEEFHMANFRLHDVFFFILYLYNFKTQKLENPKIVKIENMLKAREVSAWWSKLRTSRIPPVQSPSRKSTKLRYSYCMYSTNLPLSFTFWFSLKVNFKVNSSSTLQVKLLRDFPKYFTMIKFLLNISNTEICISRSVIYHDHPNSLQF